MVAPNPFAPPTAELDEHRPSESGPSEGQYREGKVLVHRHSAVFPDRCVRCDAPCGDHRLKCDLYWHHPAIYAFIMLGPVIYAIAALISRRRAKVFVGLCRRHRNRRNVALYGSLFLTFSSIGSCAALADKAEALYGITPLIMTGAVIWAILGTRVVYPTHIDEYYVRLKGVSPEYLAKLPSFGGPR